MSIKAQMEGLLGSIAGAAAKSVDRVSTYSGAKALQSPVGRAAVKVGKYIPQTAVAAREIDKGLSVVDKLKSVAGKLKGGA